MAAISYAARIQLDFAVLIASATMVDLSRQRDATAGENTVKTTRVSQMAAAKVESRLGPAGQYDDTDGTIGDQIFLDLGLRLALLYYSQFYTLTLTDAGTAAIVSIRTELEEQRVSMVQEAMLGTSVMDNTKLNDRYPHSKWGSENAS